MKKLLAIGMLVLTNFCYADNDEVYMANAAGGYVALTHETCTLDFAKELYPYRAYATTSAGDIYEGCFNIPSIEDAPVVEGIKIFPVVNLIDIDKITFAFPVELFTAEKP
jgi:hypothetical protein